MKPVHARLASLILLFAIVAVYAVSILSLDYAFNGTGFSPFNVWSPTQTAYFAIAGLVLISILILYYILERGIDPRGMIHAPPIMGLSFLILFSIDSHQVLHYLPYLQVFLFNDFGSLFLFGAFLGTYLTYLVSINPRKNEGKRTSYIEFATRSALVVFLGPVLLGTAFFFGISLCMTLGLPVFPFYGEGSIGSVLVVSVLMSMYVTARILYFLEDYNLPPVKSIKLEQVLRVTFEFIVAYICTTAGFSLIGGLVTDGIPIPDLIPFSLVILGFYAVIPFSILLTHNKILPTPSLAN
ncbi:MAG: hypothetical protein ACFFEA_03845 [Candidatus Thorarchaeota archaeon]